MEGWRRQTVDPVNLEVGPEPDHWDARYSRDLPHYRSYEEIMKDAATMLEAQWRTQQKRWKFKDVDG